MTTESPLKRFRALIARPKFIPALGIWDPYSARVAEALGIECVHIGGYQLGMLDFIYTCRTCTDQRCIDPCAYDSIKFDAERRDSAV